MKLNDTASKLHAGEGISSRPIHTQGMIAYLQGDPKQGDALFAQIAPEDENTYIMVQGFLSQYHAFALDFDQSLRIAESLVNLYPESHKACHYLVLALTYCGRYSDAWAIHERTVLVDPKGANHYQSACILAALNRFEEALIALKLALEQDVPGYRSKVWDDPELCFLWAALPEIYDMPGVAMILADPFWADLQRTYNPMARFDRLDPANLKSFDKAELALVAFNPSRDFAELMDWKAAEDPKSYAKVYERLSLARARNWIHLRTALILLRSEQCLETATNNSGGVS